MERRKILKSITTAGIGSTAFVSGTSAKKLERDENHENIVSDINSSEDSKKLIKKLRKKGFMPRFGDAESFRGENDDDIESTTIVPAIKQNNEHQENKSKLEQALLVRTEKESGAVSTVAHTLHKNSKSETTYWLENEELVSEKTDHEDLLDEGVSTESNNNFDPGGGSGCIGVDESCVDWNYACLGKLALQTGLCLTAPGLLACLTRALGVEIYSHATGLDCDICNEKHERFGNMC
ncbi:hypothetical protein [Natronococcus sp. A-GB7]|uniref:hypothetical protein n=1 Tax=Natronococcus sp. A-GB7 TaxID=3037649 RepID=UPI00241C9872|nr:hypothetical protein [Natronococcus sp. A-GB7]MDG5821795.1 hypothetical protein [Natronococcus sp. A-GB7]